MGVGVGMVEDKIVSAATVEAVVAVDVEELSASAGCRLNDAG